MAEPVFDELDFVLLLEAFPDRCEDCAGGLAHLHPNGDLIACLFRCPGCVYCPRGDSDD